VAAFPVTGAEEKEGCIQIQMNPFDENKDPVPSDSSPSSQEALDQLASRIVIHSSDSEEPFNSAPLLGDPISLASGAPPPPAVPAEVPRISWPWSHLPLLWSWLHLFFFALFSFGSLIAIQIGLFVHYSSGHNMSLKQFEQLFQSKPELAIGMNVVWFLLVFLFLYVTLAVLPGAPFWQTLGWRKLVRTPNAPSNPWIYFCGGIGLAVCVAIASSRLKTPEHLPIQDLLKNRTGALLLMSMAVFVAPLIEETVFRGYLYPLFSTTYFRIARFLGAEPANAVRTGSGFGIVLTGTLFGLMHGAQLGWTWGLVAMLVTVGIIFTLARALAGTVVASFLLHLGYNSMIAFSAIVSTHGFTKMPPQP
jgi:membrane protease YdiL (CAAX protease family)